jgi:hypothetical protein
MGLEIKGNELSHDPDFNIFVLLSERDRQRGAFISGRISGRELAMHENVSAAALGVYKPQAFPDPLIFHEELCKMHGEMAAGEMTQAVFARCAAINRELSVYGEAFNGLQSPDGCCLPWPQIVPAIVSLPFVFPASLRYPFLSHNLHHYLGKVPDDVMRELYKVLVGLTCEVQEPDAFKKKEGFVGPLQKYCKPIL